MDIEKNKPTWLDNATGAINVEKLIEGADGISGMVDDLQHSLHHLVSNLEFAFNLKRAKVDGDTVTLNFQKDNIEASLWLVGLAWGRAKDLSIVLEAAQQAIDEAAE